ncbi:putative RNA methyltransferase [Nocardia mangyaensis]|uniref:putative RNA methyltransferase n=1 Tax=Nocardia mangyaensis TaxID=2213200 RepID=UPI0026772D58|nr:methyltransferase domain-containing protein [Nocardia mangyaensis]MDO3645349.1 methyltransferase domain-containing protein [Nocardia mangyaensis]
MAALLACPECGHDLHTRERVLRCDGGHSFDIARQGYVGLLTGASTKMTGDTADMLDARAAFQGTGHFAPIARAAARACTDGAQTEGNAFLEVGAGTGYYLAEVLDAVPDALGIALDVSKPAARRAARAHPRMASILADAWRGLPLSDSTFTGVLSVFAPRNPAEIARVLAPGGRFVVVTPTAGHLSELVGPLDMVRVDPDKDRRLADSLADTFTRAEHTHVEFPMKLSRADVTHLIAMGPSAFHGTPVDDPRIASLPDITEVTASVTVSTYLLNS